MNRIAICIMLYDFYFCLVHMSLSIYNGKIICLFKICRKRKKVSIWSPHLSVPISVLSGYFAQAFAGCNFSLTCFWKPNKKGRRPFVLCELLKARASRPESCYDTGHGKCYVWIAKVKRSIHTYVVITHLHVTTYFKKFNLKMLSL